MIDSNHRPVISSKFNLVRINDKQGKAYSGFVIGLAEKCGDGEIDGQAFYPTKDLLTMPNDQFDKVKKQLKTIWDCNVDYLVWNCTHGDNEQYVTRICPGDILLLIDNKIVPVIGELRELMFDYEHYSIDAPLEAA
ncbi:hypothetical protein D3C87_954580 [compost metagenome]